MSDDEIKDFFGVPPAYAVGGVTDDMIERITGIDPSPLHEDEIDQLARDAIRQLLSDDPRFGIETWRGRSGYDAEGNLLVEVCTLAEPSRPEVTFPGIIVHRKNLEVFLTLATDLKPRELKDYIRL